MYSSRLAWVASSDSFAVNAEYETTDTPNAKSGIGQKRVDMGSGCGGKRASGEGSGGLRQSLEMYSAAHGSPDGEKS